MMNTTYSLIAILLFCVNGQAQVNRVALPGLIIAILDTQYASWSLVDNSWVLNEPVLKGYLDTSKCYPNLVWGDFDGDSLQDYAALTNWKTHSGVEGRSVLAFLRRGNTYEQHMLRPCGEYIWLLPKGSSCYDYDKEDYFQLKHDAITCVIIEKAAIGFIFEDGSFSEIIIAD
jgi:hypothetical protein